jgi:hypothetical protein
MKNICVLVSSFDGYNDLWEPLEQSYDKYWKDCPYNIYISTNFITEGFNKFRPINIGKDNSWSDMMIKTLNKIDEDYILLTFDDLFFFKNIDTEKINNEINKVINMEVNYYQLTPSISKTKRIDDTIKEKIKKSKYRNGTVWSLWKKETLLDLLRSGETAWEFEIKGNIRCNKYDGFYSSSENLIPYLNGVIKGVWVKDVLNKVISQGLKIDLNKRKVMNTYDYFKYKIKFVLYNFYRNLML